MAVEGGNGIEDSISEAGFCSKHLGKELEFYCETCERLICCYCAIKGGEHNSHDYEYSGTIDMRYNKVIESLFEVIKKQLQTVKELTVEETLKPRK